MSPAAEDEMSSKRTLASIGALALFSTGLSGCVSMMMSAEQKQQTCDSYASVMKMPQATAEQRKQTIAAMKQMECPVIPES
jgi:hypothetical protein